MPLSSASLRDNNAEIGLPVLSQVADDRRMSRYRQGKRLYESTVQKQMARTRIIYSSDNPPSELSRICGINQSTSLLLRLNHPSPRRLILTSNIISENAVSHALCLPFYAVPESARLRSPTAPSNMKRALHPRAKILLHLPYPTHQIIEARQRLPPALLSPPLHPPPQTRTHHMDSTHTRNNRRLLHPSLALSA